MGPLGGSPTGSKPESKHQPQGRERRRVYAAIKTGATNSSPKDTPTVVLLVRSTAAAWSATTFGTRDSQTRPIVLLDEQHGLVHLFATCPRLRRRAGRRGATSARRPRR
jgi:hypothetical protein